MTATALALAPLLVGIVLAWAGAVKLFSRRFVATGTALANLVGGDRARLAFRVLGGVELAVATLLILPTAQSWSAAVAVALTAGFLLYLGYAVKTAPDASCGCLSAKATRISPRVFGRAALLLALSLAALAAPGHWLPAVVAQPWISVALVVVFAALVLAFSPDLDFGLTLRFKRLWGRLRPHPLAAAATASIPLESSLEQLHRSDAYRRVGAMLASDVQDSWDEGDWRLVSYAARVRERPMTAVFAIPHHYDPTLVKVAMVPD